MGSQQGDASSVHFALRAELRVWPGMDYVQRLWFSQRWRPDGSSVPLHRWLWGMHRPGQDARQARLEMPSEIFALCPNLCWAAASSYEHLCHQVLTRCSGAGRLVILKGPFGSLSALCSSQSEQLGTFD